jgi:hypothetical protein
VALNGDPAPCCANLRDAIIEPTVRLAIARSVEDSRNHPGLVCVAHGSRLLVRRIIAGLPTKSTQARWSSRGSDWRGFWLSGWLRSRSLLGQLRVLHQVQKLLGQRSEDRVPGAHTIYEMLRKVWVNTPPISSREKSCCWLNTKPCSGLVYFWKPLNSPIRDHRISNLLTAAANGLSAPMRRLALPRKIRRLCQLHSRLRPRCPIFLWFGAHTRRIDH